MAGSRIDNAFAHKLSEASHDEIIILGKQLIGSTLPVHQLPWTTAEKWKSDSGNFTGRRQVWIAGEAHSALPAVLSYPGAPTVIELQSDDKALAPYRRIQIGLLILGLAATGIGVRSAISTSKADELIEAARQSGVKLGVIFQDRMKPHIRRLKNWIDRGQLGRFCWWTRA